MDVRCEQCQTEYELDESKLKPGGVTVKCTTCGHMFKVRRRPTAVSSAAPPPPPAPSGRAASVLLDSDEGERTWLIRLEDGEIKTCRELSTLQKWIVAHRVTRLCSISRTGKKWKPLGEIGELSSFFAIADEARQARKSGKYSLDTTQEYPEGAPPPAVRAQSQPVPAAHPRTVPRRPGQSSGGADPGAPQAAGKQRPSSGAPPGGPVGGGAGAAPLNQTLPLGTGAASSAAGPPSSLAQRLGDDAVTIDAPAEMARAVSAMRDQAEPAGPGKHAGDAGGSGPGASARVAQGSPAPSSSASSPEPADPTVPMPVRPGPAGHGAASPSRGTPPRDAGAPPAGAGAPAALVSAPPPGAARPDVPSQPPPGGPGPARPAGPPAGASSAPRTGAWAREQRRSSGPPPGPVGGTGPMGGMSRGVPVSDAAFVGSKLPSIRGEFEDGRFVPTFPDDDGEPLLPARSRAGLWVVLVSLLVLAGAAVAVYFMLFRGDHSAASGPAAGQPAAAAGDAGTASAAAPTPPVTPPAAGQPPLGPAAQQALADLPAALAGDTDAALDPLAQRLAALTTDPSSPALSPALLVARARVEEALAQHMLDRARLATSPAQAKSLEDQARKRARSAQDLADKALSREGDHSAALVAMADARRLAGDRAVEVERALRDARQGPGAAEVSGDADLVDALLLARDQRLRDAHVQLDQLAKRAPAGDVRARYRLAWIDFLDKNADAARTGLQAVLAAQPQHEGARALLDKLGASGAPPAAGGHAPAAAGGATAGTAGGGHAKTPKAGGSRGEDSTDVMLDRAAKLSENGHCDAAISLYHKVLNRSPSSVEALTGLGYCHMDKRDFASAHSRFRAALGISPRYQPAMWGIAEAYQRQGLKKQAIERYQAFIHEYPNSKRAVAAQRQIELMGGGSGSGSAGTSDPGAGSGSDDQSDSSSTSGAGGSTDTGADGADHGD